MNPAINRIILGALAHLVAVTHAAESSVAPHPVPWEFASDRYGVTVAGKPVTVFFATFNLHFASFDFTEPVEVQVTINPDDYHRRDGKTYLKPDEFWQGNGIVRPLSRGIQPKTEDRKVTFTITKPGQYSIERPGTEGQEDEVLFLFANPPETNVPSAKDANVIWLGPGTHQRSVDLTRGQTLYLAPGAVLFGGVNVWDAQDVRICGRGTVVYYGPTSRNVDSGWLHRKNWHPLTTHNVKGLTVEGVTFVGRSRGWTIQLYNTTDSLFNNVKVITSYPENLFGDGIDFYDSGKAVVRDSFFRTADDCFAFFAAEASRLLYATRYSGSHLPGAPSALKEPPVTHGQVSDITIERCVLWPTVANIIRAGYQNQALTTRDVTVRDCDVLHIEPGEKGWRAPQWALFSAVTYTDDDKGGGRHSNYLFADIRCEVPIALLGVAWVQTELRNFVFKDIVFPNGAGESLLRASADGLTFDNVRVAGRPATNTADVKLTIQGNADNVRYGTKP